MICVDPGVNACGVARFTSGRLNWARYVPEAALRGLLSYREDHLVIEMPRIYRGSGQQKGDLNDLLDLAAVVGYCESFFSATERVYPAQWKGQVPKKIMTQRILSKLAPGELAAIERVGAKDHNTIDAIGIGLWHAGRL